MKCQSFDLVFKTNGLDGVSKYLDMEAEATFVKWRICPYCSTSSSVRSLHIHLLHRLRLIPKPLLLFPKVRFKSRSRVSRTMDFLFPFNFSLISVYVLPFFIFYFKKKRLTSRGGDATLKYSSFVCSLLCLPFIFSFSINLSACLLFLFV